MNYIIDTQKQIAKTEIDELTTVTENNEYIFATVSKKLEIIGVLVSIIVQYPKPRFKIEGGENNE